MRLTKPTLVINASFEPIAICSAKRALKMWAKGTVSIEESYEHPFYRDMFVPSVVRLKHYRHVPVRKHTISRRNILIRDRHTCQYCGSKFAPAKLTLDHVQPRSRGGLSAWENLVAACRPCNSRKGDKTPEEANMPLLAMPRSMNLHSSRNMMRIMGEEEKTWRRYLYYEN